MLFFMIKGPSLSEPLPTYVMEAIKQDMAWSRPSWQFTPILEDLIYEDADLIEIGAPAKGEDCVH